MMKDFNFYAPTRVVFGRESEARLPELIKQYGGTKVLIHYGGGSARRYGLLDRVEQMLHEADIDFVELGGVVPNPLLSKVKEGIGLCCREGVDFILAVGGGSVIDSAKAIAYGVPYEGDVWDFWDGKAVPQTSLPVGVILTIPAAGSEMSSSCVITHDEGMLKRGVNSDLCRCKFAIMNPERTYTLPPYQTAAGATDIMMHTMERYFSKYEDATLTDAIAEALLRTVKDAVFEVLKNPEDYRNRAAIMWASSLSHNDLTECGTEKDFACHFAVNVMGVTNDFSDPRATALRGIEAIERFFQQIGMPTSIPALIGRKATDEEIETLVAKCSRGGKMNIGAMEILKPADMTAIYRLANT